MLTTADEVRPSDEVRPYQWSGAPTFKEFLRRPDGVREGAYETIQVNVVHLVIGMVFAEGNNGLEITWPEDRRSYEDDLRAQVSALWAEDWDSDEDAVYDEW